MFGGWGQIGHFIFEKYVEPMTPLMIYHLIFNILACSYASVFSNLKYLIYLNRYHQFKHTSLIHKIANILLFLYTKSVTHDR